MFEFLRLQIMKEIQSEKAVLGTRSAKDRGKGIKLASIHEMTPLYRIRVETGVNRAAARDSIL